MKTTIAVLCLAACAASAREYHVSVDGSHPFKTISAAAEVVQPGDVITVHAGIYRERVNPPRGGTSDASRIVYQAATGEKVVITGSEVLTEKWELVENDTWKVIIPNSFFGEFNPFADLIRGDWFANRKKLKIHTGALHLNGHWLVETFTLEDVMKPAGNDPAWFTKGDKKNTTVWAQFKGVNPNEELIEVTARRTVFYPENPGINYITVRGFILKNAATPWSPPTAEQIGLIGTHWSKGWIIEDNEVSYSACAGIALGKHGDEFDNKARSAEGYVGTIERGLKQGWSKEKIGSHVVRNNHVHDCGQVGIVGSLGSAFCTVDGNTIHDIYVRKPFGGAEMAGIKFHGAMDAVISNNHIYHCANHGIWLDWMNQGTRVTGNLLYNNDMDDLFMEVNHGPFVIDNNIFLTSPTIWDRSEGGAYIHNLIAGKIKFRPELNRLTPYHPAHSTEITDLVNTKGGDDRIYHNMLMLPGALSVYDDATLPVTRAGNAVIESASIVKKTDGVYLDLTVSRGDWGKEKRPMVTTDLLGTAKVTGLPFVKPDGSPYRFDKDFLGADRKGNMTPGPFSELKEGRQRIKVWPKR
ncbi:right-handed parallel beta-helix repeat-containing protein [Pontiella sulfatireligans]|uniref:Uncharacterized protein n=1 Tax=Pontiella sulfatireligans TaxID=2750658 RepID=A0A6C2UEF2_9BACT|nr:right-handed parallel beta-helix repeat-containing protein [Pontiella sulfatireligans]VGO18550.1 hypothetical protein SCARR_00603 [Pontiella sulfatireligans]